MYAALLLYTVVQERPMSRAMQKCMSNAGSSSTSASVGSESGANRSRGVLQQLQKDASAFCSMVSNAVLV